MRQVPLWPFDEELRVKSDADGLIHVELDHPAVEATLIELRINGAIERIGEVDAASIPADLDHLRTAAEPSVAGGGMGCARDNAADAHLAGELRVERVGYVVLLQVAGTPARHVKEPVIHREVDIGYQRRAGLEALEHRRKMLGIGRLRRYGDDLARRPFPVFAEPGPDR